VDWDNTLFSTDYLQACGFKFEEYFKSQDPLSKLNHILFTELRILEEVNKKPKFILIPIQNRNLKNTKKTLKFLPKKQPNPLKPTKKAFLPNYTQENL